VVLNQRLLGQLKLLLLETNKHQEHQVIPVLQQVQLRDPQVLEVKRPPLDARQVPPLALAALRFSAGLKRGLHHS